MTRMTLMGNQCLSNYGQGDSPKPAGAKLDYCGRKHNRLGS